MNCLMPLMTSRVVQQGNVLARFLFITEAPPDSLLVLGDFDFADDSVIHWLELQSMKDDTVILPSIGPNISIGKTKMMSFTFLRKLSRRSLKQHKTNIWTTQSLY